ncbi:SIMPL domain-containing protein [Streptomyces sp. M10(2022)]
MAAAREKAALYAEAAGVRLGPVIHIKDVDSDQLQSYRGHGQGGGTAGEADLTPGKVSVSAGVVLGLSLVTG